MLGSPTPQQRPHHHSHSQYHLSTTLPGQHIVVIAYDEFVKIQNLERLERLWFNLSGGVHDASRKLYTFHNEGEAKKYFECKMFWEGNRLKDFIIQAVTNERLCIFLDTFTELSLP